MSYGAGYVAAIRAQAAEIVDPRPFAVPAVAAVYANYPHIGPVLPAIGYSAEQLEALRMTINATKADIVLAATPIDLVALIELNKPVVRARYEFAEIEEPGLTGLVEQFLVRIGITG
jgi:predicted GTPase